MKKILFSLTTFALAVASASSNNFHLTLSDPTWVGSTQLKPGDYKVQIEGNKAMLKADGKAVEAPVKVETAEKKYGATSIDTKSVANKPQLQEIHVGGTNTRIVFQTAGTAGE
jgi:hypothetical protein